MMKSIFLCLAVIFQPLVAFNVQPVVVGVQTIASSKATTRFTKSSSTLHRGGIAHTTSSTKLNVVTADLDTVALVAGQENYGFAIVALIEAVWSFAQAPSLSHAKVLAPATIAAVILVAVVSMEHFFVCFFVYHNVQQLMHFVAPRIVWSYDNKWKC